jgi:peptide/nickel transport system permease protein
LAQNVSAQTKSAGGAAGAPVDAPRKDQAKSMMRIAVEQLFEHRLAVLSLVIIGIFLGVAVFADVISWAMNIDPDAQDILNRYGEWSSEHWLGTDEAGRDVFIRLIYGTRISLMVAILVAISSTVIGIAIGSIAGYFGGVVDSFLMRLTDSLLALPTIPILIIMASIDHTKIPLLNMISPESVSIVKMVLVLMVFSWMVQSRLVRGEILALKEQEYILAAKTSGMSSAKIIIKELLPNVMTPVIVSVTLTIGSSILYEAALSFLGLGIQPPTPSWGNMLNNAQEIIYSAPMLAVIPGILILIIVISFNFLGDGLQDALDPKAIRR